MQTIRIALSGTQCTGKTTLINELEEKASFPVKFFFAKEVVRALMQRYNIEINQKYSFSSQKMILEEHTRIALENPFLISDRCSLDAFAYATHGYASGKFTAAEYDIFRKLLELNLSNYDLIIHLEPILPIVSDGVRSTDVDYQLEVNKLFHRIYDEYKSETPTILRVTQTDREERYNLIYKAICRILTKKGVIVE